MSRDKSHICNATQEDTSRRIFDFSGDLLLWSSFPLLFIVAATHSKSTAAKAAGTTLLCGLALKYESGRREFNIIQKKFEQEHGKIKCSDRSI